MNCTVEKDMHALGDGVCACVCVCVLRERECMALDNGQKCRNDNVLRPFYEPKLIMREWERGWEGDKERETNRTWCVCVLQTFTLCSIGHNPRMGNCTLYNVNQPAPLKLYAWKWLVLCACYVVWFLCLSAFAYFSWFLSPRISYRFYIKFHSFNWRV